MRESTRRAWKTCRLDKLALIQTGLSKSDARKGSFVELPYLRVANVQDGYLDLREIKKINVPITQVDRFRLKKKDILLTEGGDLDKLGRGYIWDNAIPNCVHQNHVFAVRINDQSILSPEYLALLMQTRQSRNYFLSCAKQTTNLASINSSQLKAFPVSYPSLKVQTEILNVTNNWTSAIEKTERLIAAKKQRMRSLLEALILRPSNHWKSYSLSDVCGPVTRKNTIRETNVLTSSAEYGLISQLEYYKKSVSASDVTGYYLLHKGEFAYNRSAAKGYPYGAIKRLENYEQGVLSTLYLCFSVSSETVCDPVFLAHYFESGVLNRVLSEVCQEGARSHGLLNITKADFFDLPIALPSLDSQKKIAEGLSVAAEEIELLVKQKNLYEKQKSFLMSKLLSGEWEAPSSAFEEAVE